MTNRRWRGRRAISELYASFLMVGVTLSFGSFVTVAALNQFNLAAGASGSAAAMQQVSAGKQVSIVYSACSTGTTLKLGLFNFGTTSFAPTEVFVNATQYSGVGIAWGPSTPSNAVPANSMNTLAVTLVSCMHSSGQTILLVDPSGDEAQLGT